jgi:HAD superfamily hydrolase (TIGR01549 family)
MKYQAVLFDFDGTLANNLAFYIKAYDYALKRYDIHLSDKEIGSKCFNHTEEQVASRFNLPSAEEFRKYYFEGIKELFVDIPLFPDAKETLATLQKKGTKLGLISFAHRWYIDSMMQQTELANYFQIIITFNDVSNSKPDPEAIHLASKKLQTPVSEMLLVGDMNGDILMARAAKCKSALFLPEENKPYYDFTQLRKLNPDYEFSDYKEFLEKLS